MRATRCFIFTRFNVGIYSHNGPTNVGKKERPPMVDAEQWMQTRFNIMQRVCLPSVRLQSVVHAWIIIIDSNTPQEWKQRLQKMALTSLKQVVFVETAKVYTHVGAAKEYDLINIVKSMCAPSDIICTINLDSDCALSPNYIATAMSLECSTLPMAVDIFYDVALMLNNDGDIIDIKGHTPIHTSAICGLIESAYDNLDTVLKYAHAQVGHKYPCTIMGTMSILSVHNHVNINVYNRFPERKTSLCTLQNKLVALKKMYNINLELADDTCRVK
jgi:hypothetical protein